ncbi:phospholipid-translocating P-type ATPase [Encephalitozoon intestinalis ATCC 50506]|uniref:Phospholipid-translocating P-type ATPase n=1 Tax=Encephalitozoon intestinalis (strain ATCC 50506) TaxID=876142 RepID=E0S7L4_ENCIT|nr:phospholipid-translocating P-type ATPase [Encephalitozoon intestinalis ATCC 50506]ADM11693.1 phospholipid-translocating P-type ATPase [Encephalitozoon intestinalis ATCC 50506]UTX45430.1 HAD ATPase [Encephalitozoon intestinalis]
MNRKENKIVTSKYTAMTFFPLNIYHQLSRPSNLFFLLTLILLSIPAISPFSPFTYLLAFVVVVGASMMKDGVEDYRRHKQDRIINEKPANVVRRQGEDARVEEIHVEDLSAGDLIFIMKDQEVPGDVVLLNSRVKTSDGIKCKNYCFIETSNLDGETNLKKKTAQHHIPCEEGRTVLECGEGKLDICSCDKYYMDSISEFYVEDTGDLLNKFECQVTIGGENTLCNEKNVLLRGSRVRNTERVLGIVVSVGKQTKLGKSHFKVKMKISLFEKRIGDFIFGIFMIYLGILAVTSILGARFLRKDDIEYLYLHEYLTNDSLKQTGTNYILFSYLIPLSLFVTLEVSRMFHSMFISYDDEMVGNGMKSMCRNSNITEDIGMIEYILTDKTGTLTKNSMVFKYCHVYNSEDLISREDLKEESLHVELVNDLSLEAKKSRSRMMFILALLCCNSIEPLNNNFEGISQDELCIIQELKNQGYVLVKRDEDYVLVEINGKRTRFNIVISLDFTSARQRMSVVMEVLGRYILFCKGSDQKLLGDKRMVFEQGDMGTIKALINNNSEYRSLVVGYKELDKKVTDELKRKYAGVSLRDKFLEQERIFDSVEEEMVYLGTTFIEDELQEDVRSTITSLRDAGIKIWMITGDKKETAISCSEDCGIVQKNHEVQSLAIDGKEFLKRLSDPGIFDYKSIVIYRATPYHKGKIAEKIVELGKNTLSIGDGNNDVPMLTSSHVGVGIMGKEGTQASLSADFAIPEFRFLKRLILVYGRYNLIRFSKITLNAFFKNIFFISIQFLYNFFNGYSGKPIYNNFFLNYYNVLFTSFVPLSIGLFDKDKPENYLMSHPEDYKNARRLFGRPSFVFGFIYTILLGIVVFLLSVGTVYVKDMVNKEGLVGGYILLTNYFSIVVFLVVLSTQIREISFFVVYSWIAIALSVILNFVTLFFIQELDATANNAAFNLFSLPVFYLTILFVLSGVLLVDFVIMKMLSAVKKNRGWP